ncbi:MAG: AMP-dependent synthetase/ligase [Thainema sp.]
MIRASSHQTLPDPGQLIVGQTLPSLLDEACDRNPNSQALNQWQKRRWQVLSTKDFRQATETVALGLLDSGLEKGDRVALVMHSDVSFCTVDMGCLLAGLVDVPIDLTQTIENIIYVLQHAAVKALVISNLDLLHQLLPYLGQAATVQWVIVAETGENWRQVKRGLLQDVSPVVELVEQAGSAAQSPDFTSVQGVSTLADDSAKAVSLPPPESCLRIPHPLIPGQGCEEIESQSGTDCWLWSLPQCVQLMSLAEVQQRGQARGSAAQIAELKSAIAPSDLASIIYIASETKRPKGVMLTHENISANVLAAFSSFPDLGRGDAETTLLFLPLTHIFARVFFYGHVTYGHSVYLSDPNHLVKHLCTVSPTVMITVPRLIEKIHERLIDRGQKLKRSDRAIFNWALSLAQRFDVSQAPRGLYKLQLQLADRLVYAKWREAFGGKLRSLICGGAAIQADLVNQFTAAGIPVLQGYGLTETSGVLFYNRATHNRAGTVGAPIAGVETAIADDDEVLIRSPFVMQGYYQDEVGTQSVLTDEGWFHTGDLGELNQDGFLTITGVKKPLFKLSTGKYVSPLPLEQELVQSPLIHHAVTVGANQKFCGMLIFPNLDALRAGADEWGIDCTQVNWLNHPRLLAIYQALIDQANCHLPYWSTVRRFTLVEAELSVENGGLKTDGTVNRPWVTEQFAAVIQSLYTPNPLLTDAADADDDYVSATPFATPAVACPTYAKSLLHH